MRFQRRLLTFSVTSLLMLAALTTLPQITLADTYTVTSVADEDGDGNPLPGTLRQAILDANAHAGADTIAFNIGDGGLQTITIDEHLPDITGQVTLDGTTQPGYVDTPLIEIDGRNSGNFDPGGLNFSVGGNTVKGLAVYGFYTNILLRGNGNTVTGCYVGTDAATSGSFGSLNGIVLVGSAVNNTIGGTTLATSNVISGNSSVGIYIGGSDSGSNQILGNYIGTDAFGSDAVPNGNGIVINDSPSNTIGGSDAGEGNLVSGNTGFGIAIGGANAQDNAVFGNIVGMDITGATPLGNGYGISVEAGSNNTLIGGPGPGEGNLITGNTGGGVSTNAGLFITVEGNNIGSDIDIQYIIGNGGAGINNDYNGSNNSYFDNIIVGNTSGIFIAGGTDHIVIGNLILGNTDDGIIIWDSAPNTLIDDNAVAFNDGIGVALLGSHNTVTNNTVVGNGSFGVYVSGVAGTDALGTGNTISQNSISDNGGQGIELSSDRYGDGDGHQANDAGDVDTGPNDYQNHPVLTLAGVQNGRTLIRGTFSGAPNAIFRIEFFANAALDPSGYGPGETYLGFFNVTTDNSGNVSFTVITNADLTDQFITSTATAANGSTSEFSAAVEAMAGASDVSSSMRVTRGAFRYVRATGRYTQIVTLTNTSATTITGPISLVLDSLSANATLFSPTGTTALNAPVGSPYRNATSVSLAPGATVTMTLEFTNPSNAAITYGTRVLAGAGVR